MQRSAALVLAATAAATYVYADHAATADAWRSFTLETPYLAVDMPGTPTKSVRNDQSFVGDIATDEYRVKDGIDAYSVEVTELPGFALLFAGPDTVYDHTKGALLKATLSKVISFTDVTLDGTNGKRLVYDTPTKPGHPEMQGEARMFLSGDWLYVADTVVEMEGGESKQDRFFSSLKIKP